MSTFRTNDGVDLHYVEQGSGPVILFVHGYTSNTGNWAVQFETLSPRFRCVAFDRRWHGQSGKPDYGTSMARQGLDIEQLLDHLDLDKVALVGHSQGAAVVWAYLRMFGTRRVSHVITVDQSPRITNNDTWSNGFFDITEANASTIYADPLPSLMAISAERLAAVAPDALNPIAHEEPPKGFDPVAWGRSTSPMLRDQVFLDARDVLPRIDVPYLAIHGRYSQFYPVESGQFIADTAPKGRLVILERSCHLVPQRQPEEFTRLVGEFVTE